MRSSLLALVVVTACSRAPEIDLPVCAGGVPIDSKVKHSMTIDASGHVTVDGVACANEGEVDEALGKVQADMHNAPEDVEYSGRLYVSDPLLVRIDGATRWDDVARELRAISTNLIFRRWIVVRDQATGSEQCLRVEYLPRQTGDVPYDPDWKPDSDQVLLELSAFRDASDGGALHPPTWDVRRWQKPQVYGESRPVSWSEIYDTLVQVPAEDRDFVILGGLPREMPWREVAPIVADAIHLFHAQVEIR